MKRAVIMSRVSSDEQAKGFSLGVQFEQLTNYCKRKDIEVVAHYKEDHSAKNFNRPEFQNFLRFAKKNKKTIDYLLVTTWDPLFQECNRFICNDSSIKRNGNRGSSY